MPVFGRTDRIANEIARMGREEHKRTGTHLLYAPRRRCSCLGKTRAIDVACNVCDSFGWYWLPEDERIVRGIVQNAAFHRDLVALGIIQPGDMVVQFDRNPMNLAPMDRVRLDPHWLFTFAVPSEAALVTRGPDAADRLDYRISKIFSVDRSSPRTGETTNFPVSAYTFGRGTNVLTWTGDPTLGTAPYEGDQYSISYIPDWDWLVTQPSGQTGIGAVGVQAKIVCSRRMKSERRYDETRDDPPIDDTDIFRG